MDKRKAIIGGIVAILLVAAGAWGFGLFGGTDPAVAKLQEIGGQMADKNLSDAQRNQLRDQFRQQMQTMTDDQRHAFFDSNRDQWMARSQERMNEFFAMSKADQQKRLDEIINRMTQPRKSQNTGGQGQNANNGQGGRGGRSGMTEAQREERSKRRLDNTTPKMRAEFTEFRRMLDKRAEERGVKLDNQWGWGFGGGRSGA